MTASVVMNEVVVVHHILCSVVDDFVHYCG